MLFGDAGRASEGEVQTLGVGGLGQADVLHGLKLWKLELHHCPSIRRSPKQAAKFYSKMPNLASPQMERVV
jgi:hypothetical protein